MRKARAFRKSEAILAVVVIALAIGGVGYLVLGDHSRQKVATNVPPPASLTREQDASRDVPRYEASPRVITPPPAMAERHVESSSPTTAVARPESAELPAKTAVKPKADAPVGAKVDSRPIARQALDLVGSDPVAEAIWNEAINDPSVSAHDRQDLIEDLNENGFDDPAHPSADDLPLIANRISLIEQLAPLAMDDVNAAAFAEAYKDLTNMYVKAWRD